MTTIAYKGGILAADTRATIGDVIDQSEHRKVFRLNNGALVGFAGTPGEHIPVLKKLRANPDGFLDIKFGNNAIFVKPDGTIFEHDNGGWTKITAKCAATGSGFVPALVAMRMGASAKQAVKIAMEFDKNTGGKVRSIKLK